MTHMSAIEWKVPPQGTPNLDTERPLCKNTKQVVVNSSAKNTKPLKFSCLSVIQYAHIGCSRNMEEVNCITYKIN